MTGPAHPRFLSSTLPGERLERLTVGRHQLLDRIEGDIAAAVRTGGARFDLMFGPRGAGKSHAIGVLRHRLLTNSELSKHAFVVSLPEDVRITSPQHLLTLVLRAMPFDADVGPVGTQLQALQQRPEGAAERATRMITGRLGGRALVLLLENLDSIFKDINPTGQKILRNVLQTQRNWSILATARALTSAFGRHDSPFFGTFVANELPPFTSEECRAMLVKLAEEYDNPELAEVMRSQLGLVRVRGIQHVIGGSPRAIAYLYRHLDAHRLDHFEAALSELADDLRPYFQEQVNILPAMQGAVVDVLSQNWGPLPVKEIAESISATQNSASSALVYLREMDLVRAFKVGRTKFYEITDPLHRITRAAERPEQLASIAKLLQDWFAFDDRVNSPAIRDPLIHKVDQTGAGNQNALVALVGAHWFEAIGQLLECLAPRSITPELEFQLVLSYASAWHFGQLPALLPALGSLVARPQLWQPGSSVFAFLSTLCTGELHPDLNPDLSQGSPAFALFGALLELLVSAAERADALSEHESMSHVFYCGMLDSIATRRPLSSLAPLHARVVATHAHNPLPFTPGIHDPIEAFSRLSAPERAYIRQRLALLGDEVGLRCFDFPTTD